MFLCSSFFAYSGSMDVAIGEKGLITKLDPLNARRCLCLVLFSVFQRPVPERRNKLYQV